MSSNQPSLAPVVILVCFVTSRGITPPPNGPALTWIRLPSTFETQPTVSPPDCSRPVTAWSRGSDGQRVKTTAARSTRLPAAAPIVRRRLFPGATRLLVEEPLDGVEDRILVRARLGGGGDTGRCRPHVLPHAVVLLPALERIVEVDHLPLRVAVLQQP